MSSSELHAVFQVAIGVTLLCAACLKLLKPSQSIAFVATFSEKHAPTIVWTALCGEAILGAALTSGYGLAKAVPSTGVFLIAASFLIYRSHEAGSTIACGCLGEDKSSLHMLAINLGRTQKQLPIYNRYLNIMMDGNRGTCGRLLSSVLPVLIGVSARSLAIRDSFRLCYSFD